MHPVIMEGYTSHIRAQLRAQGLDHLDTLRRGRHVVIYAPDADGSKVHRARLTWRHGQTFELGIAEPNGRWAATGETGTADELLTVLMDRFKFVLGDWS